MRRVFGVAALLAPLLMPAAALAAPFNYACDTPAGHYSEISQTQAGPAYSLRGSITPLQWLDDRRWASLGQVRLENGDRSRSIAVKVVRQPRTNQAAIEVTLQSDGEPRTETLGAVGLNQAMAFELRLDASGEGVVVVGGQRRAFSLNLGPNAKVQVICSTGEYLFTGFDFGN